MPRVIFKCPYLKGGRSPSGSVTTAAHRKFYVKYIATREGVQMIDENRALLPATKKQKETVSEILREFRNTRDLFEYEDYKANPTRGNASAFIRASIEHNLHLIATRENYVSYIAKRPRAERMGAHGLFTSEGVPVVLEQIANECAEHPGNVWTPIISLRREDAARLGYDSAGEWRTMLSSYAIDMAKHLKIKPDNFRWYGAYHDEGHHPHVQMVCWSADPGDGYLSRDGIAGIKKDLAGNIFRQELNEIYRRQTRQRDDLARSARELMEQLVTQMQGGVLQNDRIEQLTAHLAHRLQFHTGKKQYGYLKEPLKAVVDEIVDELAKDVRIDEAYQLWCEMRLEVLRTYQKDPPHPGQLSQQKEFHHIRNIIITEAAKIAGREFTFEQPDDVRMAAAEERSEPGIAEPDMEYAPEPDAPEPEDAAPRVEWSEKYKQAKIYLYGSDDVPRDFELARSLFTEEAHAGNALAMSDLARMCADGLGADPDPDAAHEWYAKALAAFMAVEDEKPHRYVEYRIGKMHTAGLGTAQDHSQAAGWFRESAEQRYKYAEYSLGSLYYHGKGVDQDHAAALGLFTKAAAQGFPYASYELGKMYRDGIGNEIDLGMSSDHFEDAYRGFISLEKQSHDDKLQYRLGWMLENGVGTGKDIPAAMSFYEKAAGVGNAYAQYALAKLILADETSSPEKLAEAVAAMEKAADAGNGSAVYTLAKLYRDGRAVAKDIPKAADLFEKAAVDHNNEYAAYQLGKLYLAGDGIPKDIGKAVRWFTMSAEQNNQYAAYRLGKLYLAGEDVPKDIDKALRWLTQSAEQGNQYAQYALGKLYLTGNDVPRDREAAMRWFTLSAAQGNEYAQFFIDNMDKWGNPSVFMMASRLLHHMGRIFRDNTPPPPSGSVGMTLDRKLVQKLREKKIAQGHKEDDQTYSHTHIMQY